MSDTQTASDDVLSAFYGAVQEPEEAIEDEAEGVEVEDAEEPEIGDESEPELFTTKDGEQVTRDELLNGYLRQKNFTQKTMELAEARKSVQSERDRLSEMVSQLDQRIESLQGFMKDAEATVNMDELIDFDPSQYLRIQKETKARQDAIESAKAARQAAENMRLIEERKQLEKALPHWSDPDKQKEDLSQFSKFVQELGLSQKEVEGITNHRILIGLLKGAKYAALQAKKPQISQQVKKVQRTVSPGVKGSKEPTLAEVFYGKS